MTESAAVVTTSLMETSTAFLICELRAAGTEIHSFRVRSTNRGRGRGMSRDWSLGRMNKGRGRIGTSGESALLVGLTSTDPIVQALYVCNVAVELRGVRIGGD